MTEWKTIESTEQRTRWANYEKMLEIRVTKLREKLHSVELIQAGKYGPGSNHISLYGDTVEGPLKEVAKKVKWIKDNLENLLQEEEKNVSV